MFDTDVSHTLRRTHIMLRSFFAQAMRAHIETTAFPFMPGEVLCRVQARSLVLTCRLMQERPHIR